MLAVVINSEMESTGVVILVTEAGVDSTKGFSRRNVPKQEYKTKIQNIEECFNNKSLTYFLDCHLYS